MAGKLAGLRSVANEWFGFRKRSIKMKSPRLIARSANMDATLLLKSKEAAYRPIIIYTVSEAIL